MSKFEYTTVSRDIRMTGIGCLEELNRLGEEGWEVVGVLEPNVLGFEYILMQRKKDCVEFGNGFYKG